MRRLFTLLVLAFSVAMLGGCGGGGTDVPPNNNGASNVLFAGRWAGTYQSASGSDHGRITLQVGPGTGVSGTISSDVSGSSAPMTGQSVNGLITTDYRFTGGSPFEAQFNVHLGMNGHMIGAVQQTFTSVGNTGTGPTLNIDLAPQ